MEEDINMTTNVKAEIVFEKDAKYYPARTNALDTMILIEQAINELVIKENKKRISDKISDGFFKESDAEMDYLKNIAAVRYKVELSNPQSGFFCVHFNLFDTPRTLSVFLDLKDSYASKQGLESVRIDLGADDSSAILIPKIAEYLVKNSTMFSGYYFADERKSCDGINSETPFISKQDLRTDNVAGNTKSKKNGVRT